MVKEEGEEVKRGKGKRKSPFSFSQPYSIFSYSRLLTIRLAASLKPALHSP